MRKLYQKLIPYEIRYLIYKIRHPQEFKLLREMVYQSPKGNFSLRSYDQLKCIFVHITKTAGTSVAKSLFGEMPYHYTAAEYRVIYGKKVFNSYFKFAFVRNPWDRLHSAFTYLKKGGWNDDDRRWAEKNLANINDFNQFVLEWLDESRIRSHIHFWPQMDFIANRRGQVLIDQIYNFETINNDYIDISERLGVSMPLKHVNTSAKEDYKQAYSRESIEKVRQLYAWDIKNLGYEFDSYRRVRVQNGKLLTQQI